MVVAYGGDLSSEHINTTISQGNLTCYLTLEFIYFFKQLYLLYSLYFFLIVVSAEVTGPNTPLSYGSNFTITCTASLSVELNEVQVIWSDPYLQVIDMTTGDISVSNALNTDIFMNTSAYSLNLNFNNLQASQVGRYTCHPTFIEQGSESFILQRQFIVSVQG